MPPSSSLQQPSKTPGRSRRRKATKATPAKSATANDKENKEEQGSSKSSRPDDKKRHGSSNSSFFDDDNVENISLKVSSHQADDKRNKHGNNNKSDSKEVHKEAAHKFQQSLQRVTVSPPASLFQENEQLADNIVRASLSKRSGDNNGGAFLLLDEHHSALLSFARKLIKEAAEKAKRPSPSLVDNLFVAMHMLRGIAFCLVGSTLSVGKTESLLKLLYHLITTAADYSSSESHMSRKDTTKDDNHPKICAGFIAMSGYEGLGYVLSKCSTQQQPTSLRLVYDTTTSETTSKKGAILFAVPSQVDGTSKNSLMTEMTMSTAQLCTIALKTTSLIGKLICNLSLSSSQRHLPATTSKHLVSYGSFADMVLRRLQNLNETVIELFNRVHLPWVALLARLASKDKEAVKELLSYSKGGHRLLWDTASKRKAEESKQSKNASDNTNAKVEEACLNLRKHAILLLLPHTSVQKVNLYVRKTSLGSCCTYAWKAATVFAQQNESKSSKRQLNAFYEGLEARIHKFLDMDSSIPLEYVEYVAYRSLHTGESVTPPQLHLLFEQTSNIAKINDDYRMVLNVLEVAICCKARIEFVMNDGPTQSLWREGGELRDSVVHSSRSLVATFNKCLTRLSFDATKRIFKVFCSLSIQRTLFAAVKGESATLTTLATELELASQILRSMGKLGMKLVEADPAKASQLLDLTLEFHIRPVSVCEKVSEAFHAEGDHDGAVSYSAISDTVCTEYYQNTIRLYEDFSVVTLPNLEKAAKLFATISRHRTERSMEENSLRPLLYSLKLYNLLENQKSDGQDFQLSPRLLLLSGTLDAIGKVDDAFLVGCLALKNEATRIMMDEMSEVDVLMFLANRTDGVLPAKSDALALSHEALSVCRRMTHLFSMIDTKDLSSLGVECFQTCTMDSVLDSYIDLSDSKRYDVTIAAAPFPTLQSILNSDGFRENAHSKMGCFLLMVEIMSAFGNSVQFICSDEDSSAQSVDNVLHSYFALTALLHEAIRALDVEYENAFHSLLDLISSVSLTSVGDRRWFTAASSLKEGWNVALFDKSQEIANAAVTVDYSLPDPLLASCHLAIHSLLLAAELRSSDEVYDYSVAAIRTVVDATAEEADSVSFLLTKQWTLWCASHVMDLLGKSNDKEKAALLSLWIIALTDNEASSSRWFHSSLLSACTDDNSLLCITDRYTALASDVPTNMARKGSALWIFETEFDLCRIQAEVLNSGGELESSYEIKTSYLDRLEGEISESQDPKDDSLFFLRHWLLSTLQLVRADLSAAFGHFPMALRATQECLRHCQIIMKNRNLQFHSSHCMIAELATSSIFERSRMRYIQVLTKRPKLHYRLGDHRKADAYVRSLLDFLKLDTRSDGSDESHRNVLKELSDLLNDAPEIRLILKIMGWASTPDQATEELARDSEQISAHDHPNNCHAGVINWIRNLISVGDILYGDSITSIFKQAFLPFYSEAIKNMAETKSLAKFLSFGLPSQMQGFVGDTLSKQVELRNARLFLETDHSFDEATEIAIRQACLEIDDGGLSRSEDKAWALYYLGILELNQARRSGLIQKLWQDADYGQEGELCAHLYNAREYLSRALLHVVNSSDVLIRNILRSLALVTGPMMGDSIGMSSGILVLTSIGQSLRRKMAQAFSHSGNDPTEGNDFEWTRIFETLDGPMAADESRDDRITSLLKDLGALVPRHWSFVAPAICPSGEVLIVSLSKNALDDEFNLSTVCAFPPEGKTAYDCIMTPLDSVLKKMNAQLHRVDPHLASECADKDAIKREWWDARGKLDEEMGSLLEEVETEFFSQVFTETDNSDDLPRGNLASRFDEVFDDVTEKSASIQEERVDDLKALTVLVLKEKLVNAGVEESKFRKMRKIDLIKLLIDTEGGKSAHKRKEKHVGHGGDASDQEACLFLILDENLQRFPFEGMPLLEGRTVCRVPCLSFVLAKLLELGIDNGDLLELDPINTSFVLDPERNLQGTRKRLLPVMETIQSDNIWKWDCVIGEMPSAESFEEGLTKPGSLFMYFGHGGAQSCFSRRRIEELISRRVLSLSDQQESRTCQASVILMGCSSGRLESINRKNSDVVEEIPLYYEPGGVALSYLCAGSPCVVGNLWDVTDHDIDRFSIDLMHHFLGGMDAPSLARSLCLSRSACKLKYLVGYAPVCYGLPIYARARPQRRSKSRPCMQ